MFHPRLCSQTVRRAPFNLALPISCSVSHTPPSPSHLWPSFLISARLEFTLFPDLSDVAQHFQQTLHFARATHVVRFWPLTVLLHPPPPPGDVSHESRYPHMCRRADPVSMSLIGCLASPRFNRCSLARRGVDYICVAQRRASQLTHGINERGLKKWGLRGKPLSV